MIRVLMIAFHFPPANQYSGTKRTWAFVRHLPQWGFAPIVLTVKPSAYPDPVASEVIDMPESAHVQRSLALDASRHLAWKGRYFRQTALPDRWSSWWPMGVLSGLRLIYRYQPQLIWSTYPIATAHCIAKTLHRLSGIPWIADFRDPMLLDHSPEDPRVHQSFSQIEQQCVQHASRLIFTTHSAKEAMQARYAQLDPEHVGVISNGVDSTNWPIMSPATPDAHRPLTLLHSGHLYPGIQERNPEPLLQAIALLHQQDLLPKQGVRILLRASGHEIMYQAMINQLNLATIVELAPMISAQDSLQEMQAADGLLLWQGSHFRLQIPAKVYEYIYARRPIFALTDPDGETAKVLHQANMTPIVACTNPTTIAPILATWLQQISQQTAPVPTPQIAASFTRTATALQLAKLFYTTIEDNRPSPTEEG